MQAKLHYIYSAGGDFIKFNEDSPNAHLYQGQIAATTYYLTVTSDEPNNQWLSSDRVYIVFRRPDGATAERRMNYEGDNIWSVVSDGWETDVDISGDNELEISFAARRYSVTTATLIATRTTGVIYETIYPSNSFVPQEIQEQSIVVELEGQIDALDARMVDVEVEAAKVDDKVDKVEGKGLSTEDFTTVEKTKVSSMPMFYTSLSDISGIDVATVTPIELAWAMADNSILTAEIDPDVSINLCPDIVNVTAPGNIYVCKGDEKVTFKYTVLQDRNVLTYDSVADLKIMTPVWSGWTYSNRTGEYDVIIRTQDEFDDLTSSPTWNYVRTVAISGSFAGSDGITIPSNVVKIDGIGRAVLNFHIDTELVDASVLFGYDELPVLPFNPISELLYSMSGITINYTGTVPYNYQTVGFKNIRNISNCFVFSSTGGRFIGFGNCIGGSNLYVESTCYSGRGYLNCENMTNIGGYILGKGAAVYYVFSAPYFQSDKMPWTNLLEGCKNIHGVSGKAEVSVDDVFTHAFNISSILFECNNISGVSAIARGICEDDCAYGIVDCQYITNFDIKAETLGEYSSAIGILRSSRISTCKVEAKAINSTHFDKAAYEYYKVSYASSCNPAIPLEFPYVYGGHTNVIETIDPSAGGEFQIKKPNGDDNLILNGKVNGAYLPDYLLGQVLYGGTFVIEEGTGTTTATLSTRAKQKLGTENDTLNLSNTSFFGGGYAANEAIYYIAQSNGSFAGLDFLTGDWLISTGGAWTKVDNTDAVTGVKGDNEAAYRIGAVNITADNIGLGNVDNTADADKPVSTAQQGAIDTAVATTVKTSGTQTIGGAKTFTNNVTVANPAPEIFLKSTTDVYNVTAPFLATGLKCTDKNGTYTGAFRTYRSSDGSTSVNMTARNQANLFMTVGLRGYTDGTWALLQGDTPGVVDIGSNTSRFKDLYLAGNINAAGTIKGNVENSPYKLVASGTLAAGASLTLNNLITGAVGRPFYVHIWGGAVVGSEAKAHFLFGTAYGTAVKEDKMSLAPIRTAITSGEVFHGGITAFVTDVTVGNKVEPAGIMEVLYSRIANGTNYDRILSARQCYNEAGEPYETIQKISETSTTASDIYLINDNASYALNYLIYSANY